MSIDRARSTIRGLYAITPDLSDTPTLERRVAAALAGGARVIQYRNKTADATLARSQAGLLRRLTRAAGRALIINDSVALALAVDADGVHLGATDGDLHAARTALGPDKLLGASCYNRLELAHAALAAGADHVAFGSAFVSATKPGAVRASLDFYRAARPLVPAPIIAIGGITHANAGALIAAGVDAIAVITALFDLSESDSNAAAAIERAARNFAGFFE